MAARRTKAVVEGELQALLRSVNLIAENLNMLDLNMLAGPLDEQQTQLVSSTPEAGKTAITTLFLLAATLTSPTQLAANGEEENEHINGNLNLQEGEMDEDNGEVVIVGGEDGTNVGERVASYLDYPKSKFDKKVVGISSYASGYDQILPAISHFARFGITSSRYYLFRAECSNRETQRFMMTVKDLGQYKRMILGASYGFFSANKKSKLTLTKKGDYQFSLSSLMAHVNKETPLVISVNLDGAPGRIPIPLLDPSDLVDVKVADMGFNVYQVSLTLKEDHFDISCSVDRGRLESTDDLLVPMTKRAGLYSLPLVKGETVSFLLYAELPDDTIHMCVRASDRNSDFLAKDLCPLVVDGIAQ